MESKGKNTGKEGKKNNMEEQTQTFQSSLDVDIQSVSQQPQTTENREAVRYVVMAGDLMMPETKRNMRSLPGVHIGGHLFSVTDFPGLWKSHGMIHRGRIVPILKKAVMKAHNELTDAEEAMMTRQESAAGASNGQAVQLTAPSVIRYPLDTLMSLRQTIYAKRGIEEVEELTGVEWETGLAQEIQLKIFPNWPDIEANKASLPFTVREFTDYINEQKAKATDAVIKAICDTFLTSAEKFKLFATEQVENVKAKVARGVNAKGYSDLIYPYHRHLAAQIEVSLEKDTIVQVQTNGSQPAGASEAEIELKRRQIEAMEKANELKERELALAVGQNDTKAETPTPGGKKTPGSSDK